MTRRKAPSGTPEDRTQQTLSDFMDFAATGARLVARGRRAYDHDEMLRLAAEAILHRIGEAVARLGDDVIQTHPQVHWRRMKAMRNLVAHEYGAVDHNLVWNTLEHHLPLEAAEVQRILDASS